MQTKTIFLFLFLSCYLAISAQNDDVCICMLLDQPAYDVSLDNNTFTASNDSQIDFLFPAKEKTSENKEQLLFLLEPLEQIDSSEEGFKEEEKSPSNKSFIKKKKKLRITKRKPKKRLRKYKGKCPYF